MNIKLGIFQSDQENRAWFGKWGYKVQVKQPSGVYVTEHKTRYEFDTREDAFRAAREYMTTYYPNEWRDKGGRRKAA